MLPFEDYLLLSFGLTPDDVEVTAVPGYWRITKPCDGKAGCHSPLHSFMFCDGPTYHTIGYRDDWRDKKGRFSSPYITWRRWREEE